MKNLNDVYVITGASGFIGSNLYATLFSLNKEVTFVSHNSEVNSKIKEFAKNFQETTRITLYLLGWGGAYGADRNKLDLQKNSIDFNLQVVDALSKYNLVRVVYAGSIQECSFLEASYRRSKLISDNLYSISKLFCRAALLAKCKNNGIEYVEATIANVYGKGDKKGIIGRSIDNAINNKKLNFSSGEQLGDFVFIDDVISDLLILGSETLKDHQYFIGSGEIKPVKEYFEQLCQYLGINDDEHRKFNLSGEVVYPGICFFNKDKYVHNCFSSKSRTPFLKGLELTYIKK